MFEVSNICFSYIKNRDILSNISFSLNKGELLSVVGLNGAGKTTLLRCLIQEYKNYRGKVKYNGIDLKSMNISDLSTIMGVVTTAGIIRCDICVLDYLCMGMANKIAFFSSPSSEHYKKGYDICCKYKIDYLVNRTISTLSQGELQIVTVLRVLLQNPDIIIMDEPTAALDLRNQRMLLDLIKTLLSEDKIVIQVTHNLDHIFDLKGKVLLLSPSNAVYGEYDQVLTEERLTESYRTKVKLAHFEGCTKIIY